MNIEEEIVQILGYSHTTCVKPNVPVKDIRGFYTWEGEVFTIGENDTPLDEYSEEEQQSLLDQLKAGLYTLDDTLQ